LMVVGQILIKMTNGNTC